MNNNIDNIATSLVQKIEKLDTNTTTSITDLLIEENYNFNPKELFAIYNEVIKKLENIGIYLNFDENNKSAGLPFNLPFKKGYITHIIISTRIYNGFYAKGSIFNKVDEFTLAGNNANIHSLIKFCIDEKIKNKAKLESSIPFIMTEDKISKLNELISQISSNDDYVYNENHYSKDGFDPNKFNYYDVTINGVDYEISSKEEELLSKLTEVINVKTSNEALYTAYNNLIK